MSTQPTTEQMELVNAAINGDGTCNGRPIPYLTWAQREELCRLIDAGHQIDAWCELKRAGNIALQKSTENALRKSRELNEHNTKMRIPHAQFTANSSTKVGSNAGIGTLLAWDSMTPEQKKAAWDAMDPLSRREKAVELVKKHKGNKAAAGREVGVTGKRIAQLLAELEDQPEVPLPVNRYTVAAGLAKPKRGKASR